FAKCTPVAVAISEAVELAKTFGTEESGKFVNGVLGRIVRNLPPDAAAQDASAFDAGDETHADDADS
ncbi:MAG TPA: transcription antitermination factor NusB, partial [Synergistales bacterium]|nr:transcription antitermination factor NusB [Synergistales bacterium]